MAYTPNGYIVPAEFGVHLLPRMKNIPKQTKLHVNEIGLTNIEFCKKTNLIEAASNLLENVLFFDYLQHGSKSKRNS